MIPNFKQITSTFAQNIWRGGQPEGPDDWQALADKGILHIIKLNKSEPSDGGPDAPAPSLGFDITQLPIDRWEQVIMEPAQQAVSDAVYLLSQGNTFVHCEHGEDRTGLIVGVYRVRKEQWDKELAYQEMLQNGFHPELLGLQLFWNLHVG